MAKCGTCALFLFVMKHPVRKLATSPGLLGQAKPRVVVYEETRRVHGNLYSGFGDSHFYEQLCEK